VTRRAVQRNRLQLAKAKAGLLPHALNGTIGRPKHGDACLHQEITRHRSGARALPCLEIPAGRNGKRWTG